MKKKVLLFILSFLILCILPISPVLAKDSAQQFSADYNVTYAVDQTGLTTVTEQISLKNLTDQYYASSFSLIIDATNINNVSAFDSGGSLSSSTKKQGNQTQITVQSPQQLTGKNKQYSFTLVFTSPDFAQHQGNIWQVSVPKISPDLSIDQYQLTLQVPDSFGNPGTILPTPIQQSDTGGVLALTFNKSELSSSGILATFGTTQLFAFNLTYHLKNSGILPSVSQIALPPDTNFQQTQIDSVLPKPDNVTIDSDGNYIAWFRLNRLQSEDISVRGLAKLFLNPQLNQPFLSKQNQQTFTQPQQYWESDNPLIAAKLSDIFRTTQPSTTAQKAQMINEFVVNNIKFDVDRLNGGDFSRLGALTALNNPDSALANEFSDLFVALARADGIPARELIGAAYSSNKDLRPLSLNSNLHIWPEYYDNEKGWVMIDPTWEQTSGGVDYFSKFDLNHIVFAVRGVSSVNPEVPDQAVTDFSDENFNPAPSLQVQLSSPARFFAGFPASISIFVYNYGSSVQPSSFLSLTSSKIQIPGVKTFSTPEIAPFGHLQYTFALRTSSLFSSFDDTLQLSVGDKSASQKISVSPFFTFQFFPLITVITIALIICIYFFILGLHIHLHRR